MYIFLNPYIRLWTIKFYPTHYAGNKVFENICLSSIRATLRRRIPLPVTFSNRIKLDAHLLLLTNAHTHSTMTKWSSAGLHLQSHYQIIAVRTSL